MKRAALFIPSAVIRAANWRFWSAVWFLFMLTEPVSGVEVQGLYQASVPVSSRTDERERNRAFVPAMQEVLIKVTGQQELVQQAAIRRALTNPQPYVESFSYNSIPATGGNAGSGNIALEVKFFESEILRLLTANDIPVWPGNRPVTLIWTVIQNEQGQRQVLSSGSLHPARELIAESARRKGLPVVFPLMDIEDLRAADVNAVWNQNLPLLRLASRRYQAESILVIRVFSSLSGENIGRSEYLFRDSQVSREIYSQSLSEAVLEPVNIAVAELAGYYGVLLSGTNTNVTVRLTVDGVTSPAAYAGLLDYVEQLADVNAVTITRVRQQTIDLELGTGGQIRQLVETIALDNIMTPLGDLTREGNEVMLHYRWTAQ